MAWLYQAKVSAKCKIMQHRNRKLYHSYIYEDIANVAEKRFDILNYAIERPLPRDKNKKFFGLMKDALGRKIMT